MARVPIACTLSEDQADARLAEWQQFVDTRVQEVERAGAVARLRFEPSDEAVLAAANLARREKACCAFFEFRLTLLAENVWLEIEAPAAELLDGLVKFH